MVIVVSLILMALLYAIAGGRSSAKVGEPAPAFSVTARDGRAIDSAELHDTVVLINFFATWCKPCHAEAPELVELWHDYMDRGVIFLGITYKEVDEKVAEFVAAYDITFPVANDQSNVARRFGVTGVPETYLIGRDGTVLYKHIGPIDAAELRNALEKSLGL